ncbi:MAG: hypothetical protein ACE366_08065 [Bradymonadia bacterium]
MIDPRPIIDEIHEHLRALGAKKVVLYGYTRRDHTHHWVMAAIHRAFELILADTPEISLHWVDNRSRGLMRTLEDAVVFGNINADKVHWAMPLVPSAHYILHNHAPKDLTVDPFAEYIEAGRCVFYDVFRGRPEGDYVPVEGEPCHYTSLSEANLTITWATDLLPGEIAENAERVKGLSSDADRREVVFVGSLWRANADEMVELAQHTVDRGLVFTHYGRQLLQAPWPEHADVKVHTGSVSFEENMRLVREGKIAPALQGLHQLKNPTEVGNYVPCRIFKNISYGAWGVSNNPTVATLFDDELICEADIGAMLDAALTAITDRPQRTALLPMMAHVAAHHTYLNRLRLMLSFAHARRDSVGMRTPPAPKKADQLRWMGKHTVSRILRR